MRYNFNAESIIYSSYVKYDRLSELINHHYSGSNAIKLNIFIDVYSILKSLFSYTNITYDNDNFIAAGIINLCAHYREFFKTRYRTNTDIYIINSTIDNGMLNKFLVEYKKSYKNTNATKYLVDMNISILQKIIPYIPNVYFINSNYEFGVIVLDLINKFNNNAITPNLIITKDLYNIQLVDDNTKILRPKKYKGEDISYIIDNKNAYNELFRERKYDTVSTKLSIELLSLVMSLSRCPERGIKAMYNIDFVVKTLNVLLFNNLIPNSKIYDITNFSIIFNNNTNNKKKIDPELLKLRYTVIDLYNQYNNIFLNMPDVKIYEGLINLYDPKGVQKLNETLFANNPLDLLSL